MLRSPQDAREADAAARAIKPPRAKAAQNQGDFPTPEPAPTGRRREFWVQARSRTWNIVPKHHDEWHDHRVPGPTRFRALVYEAMTPGFAGSLGPPGMPGVSLHAEVGDLLVVHFRNADEHFGQALTMHPHGVRYNPNYDGTYLGDFTRSGGFVEPGEEFTYLWEATPDSVGVWPMHDHGPNHTLNSFRGLFGSVVIRAKDEQLPDVERILFLHSLSPPVTGLHRVFHTINGRSYAGNTPTITARVGQDVALHVMGGDQNFHDFHVHGHRWRDPAGRFVDTPTVGPNETITARFVEDNPGRWLYHCHVFTHQDNGMAGWYDVSP